MKRSHLAVFVLLLLAATLLAAWASTPPAMVGPDAPLTRFSAARAMGIVAQVARAPHPLGSPEAEAVRADLVWRMRALGMEVTTERRTAAMLRPGDRAVQAGRVENVVGLLRGRDPALPAVAIMAHSDSVADSFGAADDGAGLAVALETLRAIRAGPPPVRGIMLIVTDGEEAGLLGAHAFFAEPGRARRLAAIVNIDARGSAGLGAMFETGPGSGGLIALYRANATHRFAHSAATFLYHQLPNSTDLTAAMGSGLPALNFAFLDGEFDYHTPRDRLASLDPRTLQSLGDQILPVVQALALSRAPLPRGADGVFGDSALFSIRYPAWAGWLLLAPIALLGGGSARGVRPGGVARAAAGMVGIGIVAALAARLGYAMTGVGDDWGEHHHIMAAFGRYEAGLGLAALAGMLAGFAALRRGGMRRAGVVALLVIGLAATLLGRPAMPTFVLAAAGAFLAAIALGAPLSGRELRLSGLALGAVASLALQSVAPPLAPLLLWPTLLAAVAVAMARHRRETVWLEAIIVLLPLAYTLMFGHAVLLALGVPTPEAVGLFALVAAILVAPFAARAMLVPAAVCVVGAALLLTSFRLAAPSERHPTLSQLWGVVEPRGQAWRVAAADRPDDWTRAALGYGAGALGRAVMPMLGDAPVWRAAARLPALPPPTVRAGHDAAGDWLTVAPGSAGRELRLLLTIDAALTDVTVEGVPVAGFGAHSGRWRMRWRSAGEPVTIRFRAKPGTRWSLLVGEMTERRLALPPRPAHVVPWLGSDRILVEAAANGRF